MNKSVAKKEMVNLIQQYTEGVSVNSLDFQRLMKAAAVLSSADIERLSSDERLPIAFSIAINTLKRANKDGNMERARMVLEYAFGTPQNISDGENSESRIFFADVNEISSKFDDADVVEFVNEIEDEFDIVEAPKTYKKNINAVETNADKMINAVNNIPDTQREVIIVDDSDNISVENIKKQLVENKFANDEDECNNIKDNNERLVKEVELDCKKITYARKI